MEEFSMGDPAGTGESAPGKRRLLVLYHTGTGTVPRTLYFLLGDMLEDPDVEITFQKVQSAPTFPQPWTLRDFFRIPELALPGSSVTIEPLNMPVNEHYDAVLMAGPIWNMMISLPIWSIFDSPWNKLFKDTPVISLVTSRSNFYGATEAIAERVKDSGGKFLGGIIITDPRPFKVTGKSLQQLLLKGRRRTRIGGEWVAGVIPDEFLSEVKKFGPAIEAMVTGKSAEEVDKLLEGSMPNMTPDEEAMQIANRKSLEDLSEKLLASHGVVHFYHVASWAVKNLLDDMGYSMPGARKTHV
jgi:hypothetical protein